MKADGPPGASSNGFNENLTLMTSGKAAMWIDATVAGGMLENPKESQVAGKMGYAQSPIEAMPNGSHWLWSWAFAIPKAAKQAEAAEKFAVWATSKDYIKLVADDIGWPRVPPGTRKSTYDNPEYQKAPFAATALRALQSADPTNPCIKPVPYTGIQFVGIPEFQSFGTTVGKNVSGALAGQTSVDQVFKSEPGRCWPRHETSRLPEVETVCKTPGGEDKPNRILTLRRRFNRLRSRGFSAADRPSRWCESLGGFIRGIPSSKKRGRRLWLRPRPTRPGFRQ
jgi:hypothetical protein